MMLSRLRQAQPADLREQTIGEVRVANQTAVRTLPEAAFELWASAVSVAAVQGAGFEARVETPPADVILNRLELHGLLARSR
ncbi:hypothetical protein QEV83_01060 [Methylocapsa sp. D3K7]|uniref:hypothetical protein n=1 Tax=Methylocapsa sp. D3K7 TaxID=3041435 RepID=UPI00244EC203|nr:hypothetical protein [Methylocapsa sp. D3K7]WGJ14934.1 hypothetical protein QEV83_01060 [Methylocapsa sp. D3K7]